jgi:hypothetical protein
MNITIEPGLVFAIPLAEKTFGFGQLVAWQQPIFYMIGYDIRSELPAIDEHEIRQASPVLMGNFFDLLIRNERWIAIKKLKVANVPFPCFKIKIGGKFYIESWDQQQMREATSQECAILQFRTNHSAIVLEDALKAYFGLQPWDPKWFDSLKAETITNLSKMCWFLAAEATPKAYSVTFETQLAQTELRLSRAEHFQIGNTALEAERAANPALAELVPAPQGWGQPPAGWTCIWTPRDARRKRPAHDTCFEKPRARTLEAAHRRRYWGPSFGTLEAGLHRQMKNKFDNPTQELVLQLPASSIQNYDVLIELEDRIIAGLNNLGKVDGHDMGVGEMNIFIRTDQPKLAFEKIKVLLGTQDFMPDLKAAYRDVGKDNFTVIYPAGLTHFSIA